MALEDPPRLIAKVNAEENEELKQRMEIKRFPTILYFKQGGIVNYEWKRTTEAVVSFVKRETKAFGNEESCEAIHKLAETKKYV